MILAAAEAGGVTFHGTISCVVLPHVMLVATEVVMLWVVCLRALRL